MIIDLDSWEAGYVDGQKRRPPHCAVGLDQLEPILGAGKPQAISQNSVGRGVTP
jgi:hypothetical protein